MNTSVIETEQPTRRLRLPSFGAQVLIGLVLGTMFGCIRATMIYLYNYADTDPGLRDRYAQIKQAMRFRRS